MGQHDVMPGAACIADPEGLLAKVFVAPFGRPAKVPVMRSLLVLGIRAYCLLAISAVPPTVTTRAALPRLIGPAAWSWE